MRMFSFLVVAHRAARGTPRQNSPLTNLPSFAPCAESRANIAARQMTKRILENASTTRNWKSQGTFAFANLELNLQSLRIRELVNQLLVHRVISVIFAAAFGIGAEKGNASVLQSAFSSGSLHTVVRFDVEELILAAVYRRSKIAREEIILPAD